MHVCALFSNSKWFSFKTLRSTRGNHTPAVYQTPASHLALLLPPLLMQNIKADTTPSGFIIDQDRDHFHKALFLFGLM